MKIIRIQIFISEDFIISEFSDHPARDDCLEWMVKVMCSLEENFQEGFVCAIVWYCPSGKVKSGRALKEKVYCFRVLVTKSTKV